MAASFSTTDIGTKGILSDANQTLTSTSGTGQAIAAIDVSYTTGLRYAQFLVNSLGSGTNHRIGVGIGLTGMNFNQQMGKVGQPVYAWIDAPDANPEHYRIYSGTYNAFGISVLAGDTLNMYYDLDNGYIYLGCNNVMMNGGDPGSGSAGTGALWGFSSAADYYFLAMVNNQSTTSSITLVSPATTSPGYGYTEI